MGQSDIKPGQTAAEQPEGRGPGEGGDDLGERKEKVLHTRIPQSLDREIKRRARNLGLSVSTVVRNVLLHTFDLVEDIVTDSANIAFSIAGEDARRSDPETRPRRPSAHGAAPDAEVLGWQEAVLNLNAVCDRCNAILKKGTAAAIGIRETPGPRTIICATCLAMLAPRPDDAPARSSRSE